VNNILDFIKILNESINPEDVTIKEIKVPQNEKEVRIKDLAIMGREDKGRSYRHKVGYGKNARWNYTHISAKNHGRIPISQLKKMLVDEDAKDDRRLDEKWLWFDNEKDGFFWAYSSKSKKLYKSNASFKFIVSAYPSWGAHENPYESDKSKKKPHYESINIDDDMDAFGIVNHKEKIIYFEREANESGTYRWPEISKPHNHQTALRVLINDDKKIEDYKLVGTTISKKVVDFLKAASVDKAEAGEDVDLWLYAKGVEYLEYKENGIKADSVKFYFDKKVAYSHFKGGDNPEGGVAILKITIKSPSKDDIKEEYGSVSYNKDVPKENIKLIKITPEDWEKTYKEHTSKRKSITFKEDHWKLSVSTNYGRTTKDPSLKKGYDQVLVVSAEDLKRLLDNTPMITVGRGRNKVKSHDYKEIRNWNRYYELRIDGENTLLILDEKYSEDNFERFIATELVKWPESYYIDYKTPAEKYFRSVYSEEDKKEQSEYLRQMFFYNKYPEDLSRYLISILIDEDLSSENARHDRAKYVKKFFPQLFSKREE
jgi:hypothetical protein